MAVRMNSVHLIDLRKRIIYSISVYILIFLLLFPFRNDIYLIILTPLLKFASLESKLIATDILTPFIVPIKLLTYLSFMISLPIILFNLYMFIKPALYQKEKLIYLILTISSWCLFVIGVVFAYFLILPMLFKFIINIKANYVYLYTDINNYLNFVINILFIFGCCFLTPIFIFFMLFVNIINLVTIKKYRKYLFLLSFIIAAIITPPDVLSQVLFAIPMYLLFELGILIYVILNYKSRDKNASNK
jgi:sec-independent protein translocase protein TatC